MDGEELGKTRSQTKNEAKNGEDAEAPEENGKEKGDDEEEPDSEQNGNHAEDEKSPAKRRINAMTIGVIKDYVSAFETRVNNISKTH